jgi:Kelch motif/Galactose oxidase, central domain
MLSSRQGGMLAALAGTLAAGAAIPAPAAAGAPNTWTATQSPVLGRSLHVAAPLPGGKVLVAGGVQDISAPFLSALQIYDPATDEWTDAPSMGTPRALAGAAALPDGKVLVAGGIATGAGSGLNTAEVYDPIGNSCTPVSGPAMAAGHGASPIVALLPTGKVLIAGGTGATGAPTSSASLYDPVTNTFSSAHPMGTSRAEAAGVVLPGGKVLVAGGFDSGSRLATAEVYDPVADSWTPVANAMSVPRNFEEAAALPGGKVLVAGGQIDTTTTTATTDIYDPATNRFTPGPAMDTPRALFGLAPLPDGKLLAAGGLVLAGSSESLDRHTQIYDPTTNSWIESAPLPVPEAAFTSTPLSNGQVLIVGGFNTPLDNGLPTASLYAPPVAPGAPSGVSALAGNGSATLTFAPTANSGGLPVHYEVKASSGQTAFTPDSRTAATIIGLNNGRSVTFTVIAINAFGASSASGPSNAVTPSGPPALTISRIPSKLKLKSFLKGISFTITPSEPESVQLSLIGATNRAAIARSFNLTLASKRLRVGAKTKVKLVPSRRLVGSPGSAKVQLRVVATDPAGSKTTTKTITVRR